MSQRLTLDETEKYLKDWNESGDNKALKMLFDYNLGLVNSIAKRYSIEGTTFSELLQAGKSGLLNAIKNFDYSNTRIEEFSNYIYKAIKKQIEDNVKNCSKNKELTKKDVTGSNADEIIRKFVNGFETEMLRVALQNLNPLQRQIIFLTYGVPQGQQKTIKQIAEILNIPEPYIYEQFKEALKKMNISARAKQQNK